MFHVRQHDLLGNSGSVVCSYPQCSTRIRRSNMKSFNYIYFEDHNHNIVRVYRHCFSNCYVGCDLIVNMYQFIGLVYLLVYEYI